MSVRPSMEIMRKAGAATVERFPMGSTWTLTVMSVGDLDEAEIGKTYVGEVVLRGCYTVHFKMRGSGRLVVGLPEGILCRDSDNNYFALAREVAR